MFIFLTFPGTSMTKLALPWLSDVSSKFTLSFLLAVFPMLILLPECVVPVTEMDIGIPRAGVLSGYFRSTCQCRQEIEVMFLKWNDIFCARLDLAYVVPWMYSRYRLSLFLNISTKHRTVRDVQRDILSGVTILHGMMKTEFLFVQTTVALLWRVPLVSRTKSENYSVMFK